MTTPGRRPTRLLVGVVLFGAGVLAWVLGAVVLRGEAHSYGSGQPPAQVTLTRGHVYRLGLAGGVPKEVALGVAPAALRCTLTDSTGQPTRLQVTAEQRGTKATDEIGSFVAPVSGRVRVSCAGLTGAGVDTATGDPSGYLLVLATIALAIGVGLTLSGLRSRSTVAAQDAVDRVGAHAA